MIPLLEASLVSEQVGRALAEDLREAGDITSMALIPPDSRSKGIIEARQEGVVAGMALAEEAFRQVDSHVHFEAAVSDGAKVAPKQVLARLEGPTAGILTAERTALNFLGHLSGIATAARRLVDAVAGTSARILDTRKTTPGLRLLEKYAVVCGGGQNHRIGLFDAVLIKDNHLAAVGSVAEAVSRARAFGEAGVKVEVEVTDLNQLREALAAGADIVMLDNMSPQTMRAAVDIRNIFNFQPSTFNCLLEASGGITLANVRAVAETGVDLISVGWITHSAPNLDVALELAPPSSGSGGGGG